MNTYRNYILGVCLWAYGFSGVSQDTITFEWAATGYKNFVIQASNGESFTVHWGDGNSNPYTGAGSGTNVTPNHTYATAGDYTVVVVAGSMSCCFTYLMCNSELLSSLDVSKSTALTVLYCRYNSLSSLDVSKNTTLIELYCNDNSLSNLDVSNNKSLEVLSCGFNPLNSLDVSNNTVLRDLGCNGNSLTHLDVSNNKLLTDLDCSRNSLTHLDVSNNTALRELRCYYNSLGSLDLSNNTSLRYLYCYDNSLNGLDLSNNMALVYLYCDNNSLSNLDVRNSGWSSLQRLDCSYNSLISLDLSNNIVLEQLVCYNNSLISLDLSNNMALQQLDCYNNSLISLVLADNMVLKQLDCFNNHLPLSDLYAASKVISTTNNKELGPQTLLPQTVLVGNMVDFSSQAKFGTPDTATVFVVTQNGSPASASDYTEANGVFTFHTTGNYTITMTNEAIKSNASFPAEVSVDINVSDVGIDDVLTGRAPSVQIYPNPTTGKLRITYVGTGRALSAADGTRHDGTGHDGTGHAPSVQMYDVVGQVVGAYRIRPTEEETVIDISHLAAGLYFLKIDGKTVKVVKE